MIYIRVNHFVFKLIKLHKCSTFKRKEWNNRTVFFAGSNCHCCSNKLSGF